MTWFGYFFSLTDWQVPPGGRKQGYPQMMKAGWRL
jgi:hypothetical protein